MQGVITIFSSLLLRRMAAVTVRIRMPLGAAVGAGTVLLLGSTPAYSHHSFSMFDMERKVSFTGVVAEVQWTNPHVWIEVDVPGANGETIRHGVEFTSRVHLTRRGFTRTTVNQGDEVTFVVSPYHDGRPGGRFWTVTLPTGEVIRDPGAQREFEQTQREAAAQ